MRLVSLEVENFRGVVQADFELGPGLNVLYGPNELGKSTLAEAIRATLLLRSDSKFAEKYLPWQSDERPQVTAVLQDREDNYHKVTKRFSSTVAKLAFSKDQVDWTPNGKGRQVDDKLRQLLNWGLPSVGGKGGPRIQGLPDTYLVAALLAPQENPGKIFAANFNKDYADDGKQLLTDALQAMAEDPDFKRLMEKTQAKVREVYSETGRERTVADSPFMKIAAEIKAINADCEALRQNVQKCGFWEGEREELRESLPLAESALATEETKLAQLESQDSVRQELADALTAAIAARDAAQTAQAGVTSATSARDVQATMVTQRKAAHDIARDAEAKARDALATAQAKLQQLSTDQDAAKRQLAEAEARTALDAHRLAMEKLTRTQEHVSRAQTLAANRRKAEESLQRNNRERERLAATLAKDQEALEAAQARLAASRRQLSWHDRQDAERRVTHLQAEAAQRANREGRIAESAKTLAEKQADPLLKEAPDADTLAALRKLEQELAVARQSLEIGLSVEITPIIPFSGRLRVDGEPGESTRFESKQVFEANMDVAVDIDNLGSIAVRAGAAGARERFDILNARWQAEAEPVLTTANVKSMEALNAVFQRAVSLRAEIASLTRELDSARDEFATLADPAPQLAEAQEHLGSFAEELEASTDSRTELEQGIRLAESAIAERQGNLSTARAEIARLQARQERDNADVSAAETALGDLESALGAPWQDVQAQTSTAVEALAAKIATGEEALATVVEGGAADLSVAKSAIAEAEEALATAEANRGNAQQALEAGQSRLADLERECGIAMGKAEAQDLQTCVAAVTAAQEKLDALGEGGLAAVTEQRRVVAQHRRVLEDKRSKLAELSGLLGEYGNDIVNERLKRRQEALELKEKEEKRVHADYGAWQKLEETLIRVHQEQAAHLGNKLAGGVSTHFRELAGESFERLLLGPNLEFEGLRAGGGKRGIEELSVGAQEQLAAVLRLALARHLGMMVMLDDHLVHSDAGRFGWLNERLRAAAEHLQVIVWTCHPGFYLAQDEMASPKEPIRDSGNVRAIDLSAVIGKAS